MIEKSSVVLISLDLTKGKVKDDYTVRAIYDCHRLFKCFGKLRFLSTGKIKTSGKFQNNIEILHILTKLKYMTNKSFKTAKKI